jgi:hypothetical protein
MDWNWQPHTWKRRNKLLLGLATFWPPLYMVLFFVGIFSIIMVGSWASARDSTRSCGNTDMLELDQKIKDGRIKQLTLRENEIVALDRLGNCQYRVSAGNESSREVILKDAREIVDGRPRVEKIDESTSEPEVPLAFPAGIMLLFGAHFLTIILVMGLMPLYVILAVKDERHDQTIRIIWVVLMCMVGMFAMPIYWFLYVWRERGPGDGAMGASPTFAG